MEEPIFIDVDEIVDIHHDQIERYGGDPGIRDVGLLYSALSQPRASFGGQFLHEDLFAMAGAYLFHLVQNHPFVDGNKRVGTVAADVFLQLNGIEIPAAVEERLVEMTLAVASRQVDKAGVVQVLRELAEGS